MSLVDYASSSDDDVSEAEEEQHKGEQPKVSQRQPSSPPPLLNQSQSSLSTNQQPESAEKLPDASFLLNSTSLSVATGNDHASRVAAAMAAGATRKRNSNGLASTSTLPRSKIPKGTLPHSKNVLDTAGGLLIPPQLTGRSNVVTEDISKLFVRRQAQAQAQTDPSSQ